MQTNRYLIFLILCFYQCTLQAAALSPDQISAMNSAAAANNSVRQYTSSGQAINDNLTRPLVSDTQMTTFDGALFNVKIGCEVERVALDLTIVPGAAGDVDSLVLKQDLNLDGAMDNTILAPFIVSGVCSNGVISCDAGTWSNCSNYRWSADAFGVLNFDAVPIKDLGGCYCLNNSCGANMVLLNLRNILGDIGGGALAATSKVTNNFTATRFEVSGLTGSYYVNELGSCGETPQNQASHMDNPAGINGAAFAEAGTNDIYDLITTSDAAQDSETNISTCAIDRNITVTHDMIDVPSCTAGEWFTVATSPKTFDYIGKDAWVEAQAYCDPVGPLKLRFRALDDNGAGMCNAAYGAGVWGFVETTLDATDSIASGYKMTHPELIAGSCLDVPVFYSGSCTGADGWCSFDFTFYDGNKYPAYYDYWTDTYWFAKYEPQSCATRIPASETANIDCVNVPGGSVIYQQKVSINLAFTRPHITPTPDLASCRIDSEWADDNCTVPANNVDCGLLDEDIDGTQTVLNYQPTGLNASPSSMNISDGVCNMSFERNWWHKQRNYQCVTAPTHDLTDIVDRVDYVNRNTDDANFKYKDKRLVEGAWVEDNPATTIESPFPVQPTCTNACKTRKKITNTNVGTTGIESDLRVDNQTYEYFYYECDASNICPMGVGEDLVSACACLSEFGEAASMLNTLRYAGKDTICTSGIPQEPLVPIVIPPP